jgi:DNA-binding NarL/FixJ family response regulator
MPNLTENVKVLILSKLEEGWSIQMVAQYYNIAKSTVQRIKQTILWCSTISATFYVVKLI